MQIYSKMLFDKPVAVIEAFSNEGVKNAFLAIDKYRKTHFLLGYMRYELKDFFAGKKIKSKLPLIYFEVFEGYKEFSPPEVDDFYLKTKSKTSFGDYEKAIKKIKSQIENGNTYQVNYTYDVLAESDALPFDLYCSILKRQTTPYNAFIQNRHEVILSFSPELFFELEGNKIRTKPMKGTMPRGLSAQEDAKNIDFLKNDVKNKAENVMIVDLLRNDSGKIAKTKSVKVDKLFEVETHPTLHQMTSEITAEIEDEKTLLDIFEALFPCGSVTGAPKISTMKIIDKIEKGKRNVYCGAIGFLSPEKCTFSVPIRILQRAHSSRAYKYRVGGGIVWNSTAKDEWDETITKAKILEFPHEIKLVETLLVKDLKPSYFKEHLNRMKKSAKELGFKFPNELYCLKPKQDGILRLLLSKKGAVEEEYFPLEEAKVDFIEISSTPVNSAQSLLRHKTTYRPWYDSVDTNVIYDRIFFNEKEELTEGTRTNIILKIGGKLYTPPVECGLLAGIFRQDMLKKGLVKEKILYKKDLLNAEKIYCANSVRGLKEVRLNDFDR